MAGVYWSRRCGDVDDWDAKEAKSLIAAGAAEDAEGMDLIINGARVQSPRPTETTEQRDQQRETTDAPHAPKQPKQPKQPPAAPTT